MAEFLKTSYTLGVSLLIISMILKKIKKIDGINPDEITLDIINKYLPDIEKYFPEINQQLPQLTKYLTEKSTDTNYEDKQKCQNYDFNTPTCHPIRNDNVSDNDLYHSISKNNNHVKIEICDNNPDDKVNIEVCEPVCQIDSESNDIELSEICSHGYRKYRCHKCLLLTDSCDIDINIDIFNFDDDIECNVPPKCEPNICVPSDFPISRNFNQNDIDDRIRKIKQQLDDLSDSEEDLDEDKIYEKHIDKFECREISEEEEKCASEWDLCEFKRNVCKPCKHVCGEFAINEDLDVFKNKVIKKAEIVISCYKKKLSECEEDRCSLEKCLKKCREKNRILSEKLRKCHERLECCEKEKCQIMIRAKKCEGRLSLLLEKYQKLECEYRKKSNELRKCQCKNSELVKELLEMKCKLEKCERSKEILKGKVEELYRSLNCCKKDKLRLVKIVSKLERRVNKCECENTKLICTIRELNEEIDKLKRKVQLLIHQNDELCKENANLKKRLEKTLKTLKCLCEKYDALKKKCEDKKHCRYC